jgi:Zeta toxin
MADEFALSEVELVERFSAKVKRSVFGRGQASSEPVTVFVGGQPGAGKTRAGQWAGEFHPGIVPIITDDLRRYHPDYDRLLETDPLRMPDVTAHAMGRWMQMCVDFAHEKGFSSLIEGTWRVAELVLATAQEAKAQDRGTHAVVVAVPAEISRMSTLGRYYEDHVLGKPSRWTPPQAHEVAVAGLPDSVARVSASDLIDRFTVIDRAGVVLFDGDAPGAERSTAAVAAWQAAVHRPPTPVEQNQLRVTGELVLGATIKTSPTSVEFPARQWVQQILSEMPHHIQPTAPAVLNKKAPKSLSEISRLAEAPPNHALRIAQMKTKLEQKVASQQQMDPPTPGQNPTAKPFQI